MLTNGVSTVISVVTVTMIESPATTDAVVQVCGSAVTTPVAFAATLDGHGHRKSGVLGLRATDDVVACRAICYASGVELPVGRTLSSHVDRRVLELEGPSQIHGSEDQQSQERQQQGELDERRCVVTGTSLTCR